MKSHFLKIQFILLVSLLMCACSDDNEEGKKINMEFKRNNQLYKNIYNPIYKRFIAESQILIDFLKYQFGDYFCYLF